MTCNYLLIIDPQPIAESIKIYFSQFDIKIVQERTIFFTTDYADKPYALLIDYAALKKAPELIKQFYEHYPVPLLITSEQRNEEFCIKILEAGADDFLLKPLYPREVHARINAINRRVVQHAFQIEQGKEILCFSQWRVHRSSRQIFDQNHQELILSAGEYELLLAFIQNPQKILNREFLSQWSKNNSLNPLDRRIDVQISRLRQKIELNIKKPVLIKTIRNGGYMFTAPVITLREKDMEKPS